MDAIKGRTAFITGGARGIGLGMARAFAGAGAKLVLVDLEEAALAAARSELEQRTDVQTFRLDVRDRRAYAQVADEAEALLGPVTILCNNAGVAGAAPVNRLTFDLWDWVMGINVNGVINGMQIFVPRMIERGKGGHVVNTASGAGLAPTPSGAMYTTSKYAVVGLSEAMRLELRPHDIGVSVLCPGPVRTDIIANTSAQEPPREGVTPEERQRARDPDEGGGLSRPRHAARRRRPNGPRRRAGGSTLHPHRSDHGRRHPDARGGAARRDAGVTRRACHLHKAAPIRDPRRKSAAALDPSGFVDLVGERGDPGRPSMSRRSRPCAANARLTAPPRRRYADRHLDVRIDVAQPIRRTAMLRSLTLVVAALACASVLASDAAAGAVAPTAPSQLIVLVGQGTCTQGSTAFDTRLRADGTTTPFTIPPKQVLILTSVTWGATGAGANLTNYFDLSVDDGQHQILTYQSYAQSDGSAYVGRDAPLPNLVVKSGLRVCGRPLVGTFTTATITGFLAKDK